jgi:hypothetical protein
MCGLDVALKLSRAARRREARIDRVWADVHACGTTSLRVYALWALGFALFAVTFGYNVATPVYIAYCGGDSDGAGEESEAPTAGAGAADDQK